MILRYPLSNKLAEFLKVQPSAPWDWRAGGNSTCEGSEVGGMGLGAGPTWRHRQLRHVHRSASLVGSNGVLVLLQGTQVSGLPGQGL